jgi:hypothetical protein
MDLFARREKLKMTPSQIMQEMRADDLKKVAKLLGITKGVTRKAEVIDWLSTRIRTSLPDVVRHCSAEEKLALAEAAFGGGMLDPEVFWGKYGEGSPTPSGASMARVPRRR